MALTAKEPSVEFEKESHLYTFQGHRVLSVTQVLQILDDRPRNEGAMQRGSDVHFLTERYDRGESEPIDEKFKGYLDAYNEFRKITEFRPIYIEHKLFHPTYIYAGTIDRIGYLNNWQVLIDLKTGAKARTDELQVVAYAELCRANNIPIKKQFDLYLHEDGTYRLDEVEKARSLLPVFLACLTVTRWKEGI